MAVAAVVLILAKIGLTIGKSVNHVFGVVIPLYISFNKYFLILTDLFFGILALKFVT